MTGIVLRSRRGQIGTSWYAVRLRERLERELGSGRATAGKRAARNGRVQWLDVSPGTARADVLDDDGHLYAARIDVREFSDGDRGVFEGVLPRLPMLAAQLAAGEYQADAEDMLTAQGVGLLHMESADLTHDCSCLDWPGPCKHVAALGYVLVEAVDEHPLHLLTLRGLTLEDLVPTAPPGAPGGPTGGADGSSARVDGPSLQTDATGPAGAPSGPGHADAAGGPTGGADGEANSRSEASAGPSGPSPIDPQLMDPQILMDALGEDVGKAIATFFAAARRDGAPGETS